MYELTLNDLRTIGKTGGATAILFNGDEVKLCSNCAKMARQAFVAGKRQEVELILYYPKLYAQIRTIKRQGVLLAKRRKLANGKSILLATGNGYHRPDEV